MRRILLGTVLAVGCLLATSAVASADIGDIDEFSVNTSPVVAAGVAEFAQVSGEIVCTTTIEYGLVVKVSQPQGGAVNEGAGTDEDIEGVGAYGPNQGNEANSPCSTSEQDWEVLVQRNRDSGTYQGTAGTGTGSGPAMGVFALAGTSAEDGTRGPGPFIGDSAYVTEIGAFARVDD